MKQKVKAAKQSQNIEYKTISYTAPDMEKNKRISCIASINHKNKLETLEFQIKDYHNVDMEIILTTTVKHKNAEDLLKFFEKVLTATSNSKEHC